MAASDVAHEIVSVFDPDPERAARFPAARIALGPEEVVAESDAVYVCSWTSEHPALVALVAGAGKAVFCEKPLAVDLERAAAMTATVAAAGVVNQVGLVLRSSPAFLHLRQLAQDPAAGRTMSIMFRDDQYIPTQGMYESVWRGDVARSGAGTLLEHSIHDVDLLEWLCGPITSVSACSSYFHELPGIEDVVAATLSFASGAVGSLVSVWHDVLARPSLRRVEVLSERAWSVVEGDWHGPVQSMTDASGTVSLEGEPLRAATIGLDPNRGNPDGGFIRAVRDGRTAHPSFAVALRAHQVVDAIYRSAAAGGAPVALPDPLGD